ncbi:MAG: M20/M25/M40 family metallo-hydrolase [Nitrospinota bacterium]|nr:MAG: M20/M25/M40 family metallo-hydrolase [Nitrospinota bacterium]
MEQVFRYIDTHGTQFIEELCTLLAQPSISAQNTGVQECATLLKGMMESLGITTQILPTRRHPVVYGEWKHPSATKTLLIYGHYDVQPPEPLELWDSPPFEPTIRNGRIYARGSGDNKGQFFAHLKALEAFQRTDTPLPLHLKFLFEGEEEIGSPSLRPFVEEHRSLLAADAVYYADGPGHESGRQMLFLGLKGLLYLEFHCRGANRDLHSMRAAAVPSAAWKLIRALSACKDAQDRILIEGFYENVLEPTAEEREAMQRIPLEEAAVLRDLDIQEFAGERDRSYLEKLMFRPTFNIAGMISGYTGEGAKTVLPSTARAKVDIRLVPNQTPDEIYAKVVAHLQKQGFGDVEVRRLGGDLLPSKTPLTHPFAQLVQRSVVKACGEEPVVLPSIGGSGPNYIWTDILGLPLVMAAYSTFDENNHAPNENLEIGAFLRGIKVSAQVFHDMATSS